MATRRRGEAGTPPDTHVTGRDAPAPTTHFEQRESHEREGTESFEYVTGEVPYLTQEEMLLDQERTDDRSRDARDQEAPEEVVADRVAFDERDDVNTSNDVDRQGRRGQEERDWLGDMYTDSGRGRPNDGSRRRR